MHVRIPPSACEVETLFAGWRSGLPGQQGSKFLTGARDYVAASLWRRAGLRINETVRLQVGDWHPQVGSSGVLHVRCGKGAKGSGPRQRLVPAINGVDRLLAWWMSQVRGQFGDDPAAAGAALLPSRCHNSDGSLRPACAETLRQGLAQAVAHRLPAWTGRLTPHPLRHFCATHLYHQGMELEAIGALLGHTWISTTARYIHVPAERIEWHAAGQRPRHRPPPATRPTRPARRHCGDPYHARRTVTMRWQLRLRAAERGVFKAVEMRRLLAQAGLPISAGKMSALWSTAVAPVSIRLDDLDIICRVLGCDAAGLLVLDPAPGDPTTPPRTPPPVPAAETIGETWAWNNSRPLPRPAGGRTRPSIPPV
ncbi:tyrosine-type recombinase/integrase [Streptomyces mirabilis]|uniref:tyrosine-type recombinase/integrase n=3 Tax=Streptomyces TaxID=1883 RepID=UPI0036E1FB6A